MSTTCDHGRACSFADVLLHNLWRWVGSRQAALYSPGLHLAVASLQRKLLAQVHLLRGLRVTSTPNPQSLNPKP